VALLFQLKLAVLNHAMKQWNSKIGQPLILTSLPVNPGAPNVRFARQ